MSIKLKDIINIVTDIIPLGTVVKTLGKGVGALLTKKVAKIVGIPEETVEQVLIETEKIAERDHEIRKMLIEDAKADRQHQVEFFGKFGELDTGSQKLRSRMRPILTLGLVGTFDLFIIVIFISQMFPYLFGFEIPPVMPPELTSIVKVIIAFWFGGRTIEKVAKIIKGK